MERSFILPRLGCPFRAGDVVKHMPSGETWTLAAIENVGGRWRAGACGWPETWVPITELDIVKPATDAKHFAFLIEVALAGAGHRTTACLHVASAHVGRAIMQMLGVA